MTTTPHPAARPTLALSFFLLAVASTAAACQGTVAQASSGSTGAGGTGSTGSTTGTGAGNAGGCPASLPAAGTPCALEGVTCPYDTQLQNEDASCYGGVWITYSCFDGVGPICVCPATIPVEGATCDPCWSQPCPYDPDNDGCGPTAQCLPTGVWHLTSPPCPITEPEPCSAFTTSATCATSGEDCRWLVPGCDGGFTEGCFDAADCTPGTTCASGQSCVPVQTSLCGDSTDCACGTSAADICTGAG